MVVALDTRWLFCQMDKVHLQSGHIKFLMYRLFCFCIEVLCNLQTYTVEKRGKRMAKFCENCGTKLIPGKAFCTECGHKNIVEPLQEGEWQQEDGRKIKRLAADSGNEGHAEPEEPAANASGRKASARLKEPAVKPAQALQKPSSSPKRKKKWKMVALLLAVVLAVQETRTGKVSDFIHRIKGGEVPEFQLPLPQIQETISDTTPVPALTADIKIRYTEEDIAEAPVRTAPVSIAEPVVDLGEIQVEFKSWNLQQEEDELIVRELQERSEAEGQWTIQAYEFSLASGQDQFDTDVRILLPRDPQTAEYETCVGFDAQHNCWEDLYAEISEDGTQYIVYTDHFSIKGVKKLKYIYSEQEGDLIRNEQGGTLNLDNGIFKAFYHKLKKGQSYGEGYILPDRSLLWNQYAQNTEADVSRIIALSKQMAQGDYHMLLEKNASGRTIAGNLIGYSGVGDNLNTLFGESLYKSSFVGKALMGADIALLIMRIRADAMESGSRSYWDAFVTAMDKNKDNIAESTMSAGASIGVGYAYGNWAGALAGLLVWGSCRVSDKINESAPWYKTKTPDWPDLYKRFYYTRYVDCGSQQARSALQTGNSKYAIMQKPSSMTEDKWEKLSEVINANPLSVKYIPKKDKYVYFNFTKAFAELLYLYQDDPYTFQTVLDEFYLSYAKAFWGMPDPALAGYVQGVCEKVCEEESYFAENFASPLSDILRPETTEQLEITNEFVSILKSATAEQLEEGLDSAMRKKFKEVEQDMDRLAYFLNTKVYVHVKDNALLPGQTFKDSMYCVDWKKIEDNAAYLPGSQKTAMWLDANSSRMDYSSDAFLTPMRFVCEAPLFRPVDRTLQPVSPYAYYPYNPDFIPRARAGQKDDVVFQCTLYHYLMLGAPKQMLFQNVATPRQEGVYADILLPQIDEHTMSIDAYVVVEGHNDIAELEGSWMPPSKGSPYENKERGNQMTLFVKDEGRNCTYTSAMKGEKERYFHRESVYDDVNFVYDSRSGKLHIFRKDTGTLFDQGSWLTLTIEPVTERIIRIKEYNYYLENKEKAPVWKLQYMVYNPHSHYEYVPDPNKTEAQRTKDQLFAVTYEDIQIQADPDSFTYDQVTEGGVPMTGNAHYAGTLPGEMVTAQGLTDWLIKTGSYWYLYLVNPDAVEDSIRLRQAQDVPIPQMGEQEQLWLYYSRAEVLMIYTPSSQADDWYEGWEQIPKSAQVYMEEHAGDLYYRTL